MSKYFMTSRWLFVLCASLLSTSNAAAQESYVYRCSVSAGLPSYDYFTDYFELPAAEFPSDKYPDMLAVEISRRRTALLVQVAAAFKAHVAEKYRPAGYGGYPAQYTFLNCSRYTPMERAKNDQTLAHRKGMGRKQIFTGWVYRGGGAVASASSDAGQPGRRTAADNESTPQPPAGLAPSQIEYLKQRGDYLAQVLARSLASQAEFQRQYAVLKRMYTPGGASEQ